MHRLGSTVCLTDSALYLDYVALLYSFLPPLAIEGRFSSFAGDVSRCRKKLDVHASTCAAAAQPPPISMTAAASSSSTIGGIRHFFGSSSVSSAMNAANSAPPVYYFLYLLSAGVGEYFFNVLFYFAPFRMELSFNLSSLV